MGGSLLRIERQCTRQAVQPGIDLAQIGLDVGQVDPPSRLLWMAIDPLLLTLQRLWQLSQALVSQRRQLQHVIGGLRRIQ